MKKHKSRSVSALPRNIWAVSLTSFFMDISSEMVINLLPLFLSNVLGIRTSIIGLIEGIAEMTASLLKLFSGWLSDKLGSRKWLAVAGYSISALTKPLFYFANSWGAVAAARWSDRLGKGIRTAPRDALVADSISEEQRGFAFGFHRAADTGGAMLGLLIALFVVWRLQSGSANLELKTFRLVVLISLIPAALAVLSLILIAKEVSTEKQREKPKFAFRALGGPFIRFIFIVSIFDLGNASDAFLVLRAQERGLNIPSILAMLVAFNFVYALLSTPAGKLSDRIGRRWLIIGGWVAYAIIYLGYGLASAGWQIWSLYILYGVYYALTYGTSKAMVADLVPTAQRGIAYGTYNAVLGILDLPASVIAGFLWQMFGAPAPFIFGAALAGLSAALLIFWSPEISTPTATEINLGSG